MGICLLVLEPSSLDLLRHSMPDHGMFCQQELRSRHGRLTDGKTGTAQAQQLPKQASTGSQAQESAAASRDIAALDDAAIERDLAQMKEDRLKAIPALPKNIWGG